MKTFGRILILGLACACGGAPDAGDATADAAASDRNAVPRIPIAPTAADALPAALLGTAPAPRGTPLRYLDGDSATVGYLAVPEGDGPFPAVLLIHEWNGLVDRIRVTADALAAEGYVALAADLYGGRTGANAEQNMALVNETLAAPDRVVANLDAAVRWLRAQPYVTGRVAAMGWCFGGGIALTWGLDGENHEGTAIFYGRLLDDPARLATLSHEVYGTFAALDEGIPPAQVEAFVGALREAGIPNDVHVYDDVNHGFWLHVDQDPEARSGPALDAWQRLKAYLGRTLR